MIKNTKLLIEIMQAYVDGKQIQYRGPWSLPWKDVTEPIIWNFANFEYRVKPENMLRPYANAKEFLDAYKAHDSLLKRKVDENYYTVLVIKEHGIVFNNGKKEDFLYYDELIKVFTFSDDSPCGITMEE